MKRPIGICMVTGAFYPEISGGGLQCRTLINSLKGADFNFFVLTTARNGSLHYIDPNIDVIRINIKNLSSFGKLKAALQFINVFFKLKNKIDIVHLHGFSDKTLLIILLSMIFRKKIIQKMTSFGDDDPASISRRRFGRIKKFLFCKADLFISVNPVMSKRFLDYGLPENRLVTIPNGVDIDRFCPPKGINEKIFLREELHLRKDTIAMLFVGFFSRDKGPHIFFEAFKKIKAKVKEDMCIIFIGATDDGYCEIDKNLAISIKQDAEKSGMEKDIIFIEKALEIEKYYKASDIFVLSSLREGLPNALMEAMASGLACISSDLEGIKDYLISNRKEGLLSERGDIEGFSKAMGALLENRKLLEELGANARKKIIENFSIQKVSKQYQHLYVRICSKS